MEWLKKLSAAIDKPVPSDMLAFEVPSATWAVFENNGLPYQMIAFCLIILLEIGYQQADIG